MFHALPAELKALSRWVLWRLEERDGKWTKVPLQASNGAHASVTNPSHWTTFEAALATYEALKTSHNLSGIGFVLGDGICGLDLDNVYDSEGRIVDQRKYAIARAFKSYTERSPSGTGIHVIMRASVGGKRDKSGIEIYSEARYFTMTGDVLQDGPVADCQAQADELVKEIEADRFANQPITQVDYTVAERITDMQLYEYASTAENGEKFLRLWNGNWTGDYPSQSQADSALINILAYYTDAPSQVDRMFLQSGLGQRKKALRGPYRAKMVAMAFDRKVPMVDVTGIMASAPMLPSIALPPTAWGQMAAPAPMPEPDEAEPSPYSFPAGLVGEIADFIYRQSPYPMVETALAASLGLMAGICGRQYQVGRLGLNLYIMLLAGTGAGKEAMAQGIGALMDAVSNPPKVHEASEANLNLGFPASKGFLGAGELTGKGALNGFMRGGTLSYLSIQSEFAFKMAAMSKEFANPGDQQFQKLLLELYMKSSEGNPYRGTLSADKEKDVPILDSPALSILCESTPEKLYGLLDETMVASGLLPRFTIIEAKGYPDWNVGHETVKPSENLVMGVKSLCLQVLEFKASKADFRVQVMFKDEDTVKLANDFREWARNFLKAKNAGEVHKELWNRAHLKTLRMAALVAIGQNRTHPIITPEIFNWAGSIVVHEIKALLRKFQAGEIGKPVYDDAAQYDDLRSIVKAWNEMTPDEIAKSKTYSRFGKAKEWGGIPYSFMFLRSSTASFKKDKRGHKVSLEAAIKHMMDIGELEQFRPTKDGQPLDERGRYYRSKGI